jgi:ABC-2 type transport system permease protein
VRRSSIVIGKCLGGAIVASFQGVIVIAIAGLVDVPYDPGLIFAVFGAQLLLAFTLTAFGVMVAARVKQMQSFMALTQMLVLPLYFVSGAMFPASHLPTWLSVLNRIDPLTYAIDPIRKVVFDHLDMTPQVRARLDPGITWGGWHVPVLLELAVVAALGAVMLGVAIIEFNHTD